MAGIKDYSTTANSNSSLGGLSCAENTTQVSSFNNFVRQLMADIRDERNHAEWFEYGDGDGAATVSYVSSTSFKIAGADVTAAWHAGRRVKVVAATPGTIYGTIASVAFSTDTTVTVTWDSGSLSNESLTAYLGILSAVNPSAQPASTTVKGVVELATTTEALTGTDATRAMTPDALAAFWEKGSDIASASSISIGEGGYFHVTGTTTITDIDFATDKAGRHAWLIYDGIVTITNSSSLICQGGANITTAAGDMSLVISEDGSDIVRLFHFRKSGAQLNPVVNSYAKYSYAVSSGTGAGNTAATTWTTLPLNTEDVDSGAIGTLSSNAITLGAGTYRVHAYSTLQGNGLTVKLRLRNTTDSTTALVGTANGSAGTSDVGLTFLSGEFTITGSKVHELQYYASGVFTNGLGGAVTSGESEVYRVIEFTKVA